MSKVLAHRGPDGEGAWVDARAGVALGHRRLAVIDPSAAGHQPMVSPCGRYVVVFNGELYDFEALRETVEVAGTRVSARSDTAVLVAALSTWGVEGSLARFDGIFALAIWDRAERRLHLARDPFGKKPLYVHDAGSTLWFGSELKALRAHPEYARAIDREALAQHVRFSFIVAPRSIDLGTEKLRAGEHRWFEAGGGKSRRFFDWGARAEAAARDPFRGSRAEALEALGQGITQAVRRRLVADVPIGALLSGGVDSSLVAATAQLQQAAPLRTFHIGFEEAGFDERDAAAGVARRLGTRHETWVLGPEEARARIPVLPWLFDEPFGDTAQLGMALLCEATRREVTVALSGDGGDEVFLGYPRTLRCVRRGAWLARVPPRWRAALGQVAERAGPRGERIAMGLGAAGPDGLFVTAASRHPATQSLVRGASEGGGHGPALADGRRAARAAARSRPRRSAARVDAGEGGPHEHGTRARGAIAAPRPRSRRLRAAAADALARAGRTRQAAAVPAPRPASPEGVGRASEAGLRAADRGLAARPPARLGRRSARTGSTPATGAAGARRGRADLGAPPRRPGRSHASGVESGDVSGMAGPAGLTRRRGRPINRIAGYTPRGARVRGANAPFLSRFVAMAAPHRSRSARVRAVAAVLAAGFLLGWAAPVAADEYDPQRAGHPVRIAAYALHPIGVIIDVLLLRPAHWIGSLYGVDEFVGHEPYVD